MKKFTFLKPFILSSLLILCINIKSQAQNCLGGADIIQGKVGATYLKSIGTNRLVVGGAYYTSYSPNNIMGGDTVTARAGDLLTIYAAILDSNLYMIRMFNVIGFNDMGGSFNDTRVFDMHADTLGNIYFSGAFAQDTLVSYFGDTVPAAFASEAFIQNLKRLTNEKCCVAYNKMTDNPKHKEELKALSAKFDQVFPGWELFTIYAYGFENSLLCYKELKTKY